MAMRPTRTGKFSADTEDWNRKYFRYLLHHCRNLNFSSVNFPRSSGCNLGSFRAPVYHRMGCRCCRTMKLAANFASPQAKWRNLVQQALLLVRDMYNHKKLFTELWRHIYAWGSMHPSSFVWGSSWRPAIVKIVIRMSKRSACVTIFSCWCL